MRLEKLKLTASTNSSSTNTYILFADSTAEAFYSKDFYLLIGLPVLKPVESSGSFLEEETADFENNIVYLKKENPLFTDYFTDLFFSLVFENFLPEMRNRQEKKVVSKIKDWIKDFLGREPRIELFSKRFGNAVERIQIGFYTSDEHILKHINPFFKLILSIPLNKTLKKYNPNIPVLFYKWLYERVQQLLVVIDVSEGYTPSPKKEVKERFISDHLIGPKEKNSLHRLFIRDLKKFIDIMFKYKDQYTTSIVGREDIFYKVFEGKLILHSKSKNISAVFDLTKEELDFILNGEK